MRILITDWAFDAYTDMVGRDFTKDEYWSVLRPDIERLFSRRVDPRFTDPRFWGPAQTAASAEVLDGFKMKWHNIGPGRIQLRLGIAVLGKHAWLCDAYNKTDTRQDYRMGVRLADRILAIRGGAVAEIGEIRDRRN